MAKLGVPFHRHGFMTNWGMEMVVGIIYNSSSVDMYQKIYNLTSIYCYLCCSFNESPIRTRILNRQRGGGTNFRHFSIGQCTDDIE